MWIHLLITFTSRPPTNMSLQHIQHNVASSNLAMNCTGYKHMATRTNRLLSIYFDLLVASIYSHETKPRHSQNLPRSDPENSLAKTNLKPPFQPTPNYRPDYADKHVQQPRTPSRSGATCCGISANTWRAEVQPHNNTTDAITTREYRTAYRGRHGGGSSAAARMRRSSESLRTRGVSMAWSSGARRRSREE